jgi:hypothetical protein
VLDEELLSELDFVDDVVDVELVEDELLEEELLEEEELGVDDVDMPSSGWNRTPKYSGSTRKSLSQPLRERRRDMRRAG